MDFSFVSPHPVSAARLQVACATDRYKMFSHRAQRSLAAKQQGQGQAQCMAATCMGTGTAPQGTPPCAPRRALCSSGTICMPWEEPRHDAQRTAVHTHLWVLSDRRAHRQQKPHKPPPAQRCPSTAPRNSAAVAPWRNLQHFYSQSAIPSQSFFFFPPLFPPLLKEAVKSIL